MENVNTESKKIESLTLGELMKTVKKDANRFNKIRSNARTIAKRLEQKCQKCGYDKHVEVCHKKPISEFSDDTLISEINNINNLLVLCPNCHWEFDNEEKKKIFALKAICKCGGQKNKYSIKCRKCENLERKKIKNKLNRKELLYLINNYPFTKIGLMFEVSDNTIRKWCKNAGITLPKRNGYWAKIRADKNQKYEII